VLSARRRYKLKQKKLLKKQAEKDAKKARKKAKKKGKEVPEEEEGGASPVPDVSEKELLAGFRKKGLPTDDELFKATGGARLGMRAQRRAEGK
jgi:hypothetical protein